MNPFERLGRGLFDTWESVAAGWHELWQRAGNALTRFQPSTAGDDDNLVVQVKRDSARWGLLAAEVTESPDELEVRIEAPGMEPSDFEVDVVGNQLVVRGEKRIERQEGFDEYSLIERAYGRFERRVTLSALVDSTQAKASYKRGVLRIRLPKLTRADRKSKINVSAG